MIKSSEITIPFTKLATEFVEKNERLKKNRECNTDFLIASDVWDNSEFIDVCNTVWDKKNSKELKIHVIVGLAICYKDYHFDHQTTGLGDISFHTRMWTRISNIAGRIRNPIVSSKLLKMIGGRCASDYMMNFELGNNSKPLVKAKCKELLNSNDSEFYHSILASSYKCDSIPKRFVCGGVMKIVASTYAKSKIFKAEQSDTFET